MLKLGCKITYIPTTIVYHKRPDLHQKETIESFIGKGPLFTKLYNKKLSFFLIFIYAIKKAKYIDNLLLTISKMLQEWYKFKK